jgi:3-deoxy-D-manno-octulosonate 8-phosphate phosphatase (KDO 8-P phosphatase)
MVSLIAAPRALSPRELSARAARIALVLTDCDGVLTDGGVYYSDHGEALKRFSMRDGMGVERLRNAGIATGLITRERSAAVARRARKLGLERYYEGVLDKGQHLELIQRETRLADESLAYIGDDVNDLGLLERIGVLGLTAAPADAMPEVACAVHFRCRTGGGHGAFREFAEWILSLRNATTRKEVP